MKRIILKRCDVRRETFRAGGKGGQHQNKTESAVRYVHIPTGLRAEARTERSQHQNDAVAWTLLQAKLDRLAEQVVEGERLEAYLAKPEASFGQQIRSYRMCGNEQVAIDHRTGVQLPAVLAIRKGQIEAFLEARLRMAG